MYQPTTALKKILAVKKRIRAISGGTGASKTIGIIQNLIDLCQRDKTPTLTSIVSESMPHLKKGAIRDFQNIMMTHKYWRDAKWSETDKLYIFETRSQIEFFGADQADKLRGGRRNRLFINEANNISFRAFEELEVRTRELVYLDWNPVSEFWFYTEVLPNRDDVEHITLNYLDNEALDEATIKSIEQRKDRMGWWKVYGLGELYELEGLIYSGWQIIDKIPHEARLERYGLDFGYTNDPTAIVAIYYYNGGYILEEKVYQKGMSNKDIADVLKNLPTKLIIADSAEPKSIDEIKSFGINILPAEKGKDSVRHGIQTLQEQKISITKQSVNLIKEYRNYMWQSDKNGKILNEPEKGKDHTLDAVRYAITSLIPIIKRRDFIKSLPQVYPSTISNPAR
jgi:phage terminase large subunit